MILPITHNIEHVEAKEATCFEEGNIEYWYCVDCGSAWTDELLRQVTNLKNVILPITHNIEHVEAKAATCFEDGNIEYWYCTECGFAWLDEMLHLNTNLKAVVLAAAHAELTHVEAKAPTCIELGNVEFWYCAECGMAWLDAEGTLNTNMMAVKLPMADHTPDEPVKVNDTGDSYDLVTYCSVCGKELERKSFVYYLMGDVNLDGKVTLADVTMITRKYLEDESQAEFNYIQEILADVNLEGGVTLADVTMLTRYYLEDSAQTWVPYYVDIEVR